MAHSSRIHLHRSPPVTQIWNTCILPASTTVGSLQKNPKIAIKKWLTEPRNRAWSFKLINVDKTISQLLLIPQFSDIYSLSMCCLFFFHSSSPGGAWAMRRTFWVPFQHNQIEDSHNNNTHSWHLLPNLFPFVFNWHINQTDTLVRLCRVRYCQTITRRNGDCTSACFTVRWREADQASRLEATYRKEDPLHLQDFTGHNRVYFPSAVLAHPSMLCWFLSTWLDNECIWPPGSCVCLADFLIVIHCRSAEFWPALLHMIVSDPWGSFERFSHLRASSLTIFEASYHLVFILLSDLWWKKQWDTFVQEREQKFSAEVFYY